MREEWEGKDDKKGDLNLLHLHLPALFFAFIKILHSWGKYAYVTSCNNSFLSNWCLPLADIRSLWFKSNAIYFSFEELVPNFFSLHHFKQKNKEKNGRKRNRHATTLNSTKSGYIVFFLIPKTVKYDLLVFKKKCNDIKNRNWLLQIVSILYSINFLIHLNNYNAFSEDVV